MEKIAKECGVNEPLKQCFRYTYHDNTDMKMFGLMSLAQLRIEKRFVIWRRSMG